VTLFVVFVVYVAGLYVRFGTPNINGVQELVNAGFEEFSITTMIQTGCYKMERSLAYFIINW